jgi:hypothetical protein
MNEIADRSGCIAAPAFDVAAYSAAMRALVEAPDADIIARGRACRARVQDYRWDAVAKRQEAFYLERADRAPPRSAHPPRSMTIRPAECGGQGSANLAGVDRDSGVRPRDRRLTVTPAE